MGPVQMKKISLAKMKKKLWKVFSPYIRTRDKGVCFTCGKAGLSGSGYHAGHCIPKGAGGLLLFFHEQNVHGQCFRCNINLGGNGAVYAQRIREVYGDEKMNEIYQLRGKIAKWTVQDYEDLIEEYKQKLIDL